MKIEFYVNGKPVILETPPLRNLLSLLREDLGLTGTKEGCGEGECGACAVHLDGELVNSCMVPAFQLPGRRVVTIEGISAGGTTPLQQAFLEEGAVQCGFCTPGMVMASEYLLHGNPSPNEAAIRRGLAGNLCRCTGYASLVRGVERAVREGYRPSREPFSPPVPQESLMLEDEGVFRPASLREALDILDRFGEEVLPVAGGTDILPDIAKGVRKKPSQVMDISALPELLVLEQDGKGEYLKLGAGLSFAAIARSDLVERHAPMLREMALEVGAAAVQNRATLGGNLMTASGAADSPPVLLALDAVAVLASAGEERRVPLRDLFTGYRQTLRTGKELLLRLCVPLEASSEPLFQRFFKVGSRKALTISRLSLACSARVDPRGTLSRVRVGVGSVTPWPVLLPGASEILENRVFSLRELEESVTALAEQITPRKDSAYRQWMIGRLLFRFFSELLSEHIPG